MELFRCAGLLIVALSLLTAHFAHAMPISPSSNLTTTTNLERRECKVRPTTADEKTKPDPMDPKRWDCDMKPPTLKDIVSHLRDPAYDGLASVDSTAFFYTGLGAAEGTTGPWMIGWLRSQGITKYYWTKNAIVPWFNAQLKHINANKDAFRASVPSKQDPGTTLILCAYEALSLAAVNPKVYLFTPDGHEAKRTSIWNALEYPALTRNPNVKEIWRVDPRPPKVKGLDPKKCDAPQPKLMWSRARGDAQPKQLLTCEWT